MKVETFFSEINIEDLDRQINKFVSDGNYQVTDIKRTAYNNGGWTDYSAQVQYTERLDSMIDIVAQLEFNILNNQN
tara:strand:- start:157 stop:384 length:228 start_codon:yes stop_codon:yes gene_type:complete